jgi:hypothetical protein
MGKNRGMVDAIAESVGAVFPKSAGRIQISYAWRREDSTLAEPSAYGSDGWSRVGRIASWGVLSQLRDEGFTHVALQPSRTMNARSPVRIDSLLR